MADIDYDACYAALLLKSGANLKQVNEAWRRLSRIHHPDQHTRDPRAHKQALEKQKQLNNARDVLKTWFELNPSVPPPRKSQNAGHSGSPNSGSTSSQSNNADRTNSQASGRSQGTCGCKHTHGCHCRHSHQRHGERNRHTSSNSGSKDTSGSTRNAKTEPLTGWFSANQPELTMLQKFVHGLAHPQPACKDQAEIIGAVVGLAAVFGPMCIISTALRWMFPDLPSDYPDWLQMLMLIASGFATWYLFRWFFAESEIIKLQEKVLYFKTDRSLANTIEFLKLVIAKQKAASAEWSFSTTGTAQEAVLEYEEQILPELKRKRRLVVAFAAKTCPSGVVAAVSVKAKSPINSFSCNRFAKAIISELKNEFHELAT